MAAVLPSEVDLLVLGGGAGGLTAARQGRRLGATVVLVTDGPLGGDCTWTGCIPSKALLAAAAGGASFDEALRRVEHAVQAVAATENEATLAAEGIRVIQGHGVLRAPGHLEVDGTTVRARRTVVATGGKAGIPNVPGLDALAVLTNDTVFERRPQPTSLAVLGGGAIGCELAQAFARLGTKVTVIEALPRLLAREEPETSAAITTALQGDGVTVLVGSTVGRAAATHGGASLHLADGTVVEAQHVLVAAGRTPSSSGMGLETIGVKVDERGHVVVDAHLLTSVAGIYAIGDVTAGLQLTHVAARMAFVAAHNALGSGVRHRPKVFDDRVIPRATFTSPEVGRVGLTEAEAAALGPARVAYMALEHVDRAVAVGETNGFVKLIAGRRRWLGSAGGGRILGATVVAPTGGDVIHEVAVAMQTNMFTGRLAQTVHAYPSWSMAVQQAALQFFMPVNGISARPAKRSPS